MKADAGWQGVDPGAPEIRDLRAYLQANNGIRDLEVLQPHERTRDAVGHYGLKVFAEDFEGYQTDEDHERKDDGQEEMKDFLDQLHSRIDTLDKALQEADQMITESTAEENMLKRVQERRSKGQVMINSVAEFFKEKIKQKDKD